MDGRLADVGRVLRSFIRKPRLLICALLTLAPALAASGVGLALVWTVLLRPLPYPAGDRLAVVEHTWSEQVTGISTELYRFYAEQARTIERIGLVSRTSLNLTGRDQPRRVTAAQVTASTLELLGARPALGRPFEAAEDRAGAPPTVVLTHALWTEAFGGDRSVIGQPVELDGIRRTVVGVLAPDFEIHEGGPELLVPMELDPAGGSVLNIEWWHALVRLAPGVSADAAQRELAAVLDRLVVERPDGRATPAVLQQYGIRPVVTNLATWQTQEATDFILLLAASLLLLLVLAAAALATLMLGRAEGRADEMRLRRALGASERRIVGYLLADAVVVCGASGVLGGASAWALMQTLSADPNIALPALTWRGFLLPPARSR